VGQNAVVRTLQNAIEQGWLRQGRGEPNAMVTAAEPAPLRAYDEPKLAASGRSSQEGGGLPRLPAVTCRSASWLSSRDAGSCSSEVSFPYLMSSHNAPDGTASLQAEVYYSPKYRPLEGTPDDYIEPVNRDLIQCGIIDSLDEVIYKGAMPCEYATSSSTTITPTQSTGYMASVRAGHRLVRPIRGLGLPMDR
jgi:hypothetical protein